jgi:hypothetical protein
MPKKLTNPPVKDPILFRPTNPAARATGGPLPTPTTQSYMTIFTPSA